MGGGASTGGVSAVPPATEVGLRAAVGGLVEVVSSTFGGWTWAHLVSVTEGDAGSGSAEAGAARVETQYGQRTKLVRLTPGWQRSLRNPVPLRGMAEVNSESFGGWIPARLVSVSAHGTALRYGERTKIVRLGDPKSDPRIFVRKPTAQKLRLIQQKHAQVGSPFTGSVVPVLTFCAANT